MRPSLYDEFLDVMIIDDFAGIKIFLYIKLKKGTSFKMFDSEAVIYCMAFYF